MQLLGAAQTLRTRIGAARPESDERAHAARVAALRAAIGTDAFDRAWSTGTSMDLETVVESLVPAVYHSIGTTV